jgi:peroxiredoxin
MAPSAAPAWQTTTWLNSDAPLGLEHFRGRVVLLHAFQMLCPACISHGLPQAHRVHKLFSADQLAVIGLHTVFEHHAVMGPEALEAFIEEYGWPFPIAVDAPASDGGPLPLTMRALRLRGTPSLVLIDREGRIRFEHFGTIDDLALGAVLGQLVGPSA